MTFPLGADSEHDARERLMAKPDVLSASQRSDAAITRAAAVPPESRRRSRTEGPAGIAPATHTCGSTTAGLDQPRPTVALLARSAHGASRGRTSPTGSRNARPKPRSCKHQSGHGGDEAGAAEASSSSGCASLGASSGRRDTPRRRRLLRPSSPTGKPARRLLRLSLRPAERAASGFLSAAGRSTADADRVVLVAERGACERVSPAGQGWPAEWARTS
jgi:hypothetical protein